MSEPTYRVYSIEWDPNGQSYLDWGKIVLENPDYGLDFPDTV